MSFADQNLTETESFCQANLGLLSGRPDTRQIFLC